MKKENLFEEYTKPEMVVIEMEMEGAILEGSLKEEITEDSQMQGFGDSWNVWQ